MKVRDLKGEKERKGVLERELKGKEREMNDLKKKVKELSERLSVERVEREVLLKSKNSVLDVIYECLGHEAGREFEI